MEIIVLIIMLIATLIIVLTVKLIVGNHIDGQRKVFKIKTLKYKYTQFLLQAIVSKQSSLDVQKMFNRIKLAIFI